MTSRSQRILEIGTHFFNTETILIIDICVSTLASAIVLLAPSIVFPEFLTARFSIIWLVSAALTSAVSFILFRSHKLIIRHTTLKDLLRLFLAVVGKDVLMCIPVIAFGYAVPAVFAMLLIDLFVTFVMLVLVRVAMIVVYENLKNHSREKFNKEKIIVFGTGGKSVSVLPRLMDSPHYSVVGFIVPRTMSTRSSYVISELPVYAYDGTEELQRIIAKRSIDAILFATEADARANQDVLDYANANGVKLLITPTIDEMDNEKVKQDTIREIKIEDLLCRPEIKISMDAIRNQLKYKIVLVTGAAGSIGSELVRQIATMGVRRIILFDNAETPMHYLRLELDDRFPELEYIPVIGDVRHKERIDFAFRTYYPDVVFHAAAYKHVPLMEENPCEAIRVNVNGTANVAEKCIEYGIGKMVMISTDKAVNPTNVMGCSKRIAEIYVQSLGLAVASGKKKGVTKFVTTRFGNVLGSNGSVIPRFREQIAAGGPVTVTHPEINRFFMTIPEACRLVLEAATLSDGNEIFVFDMGEPVKIDSLARRMIELAGFVPDKDIKIEYTGLRPGEKLYEEVLADAEHTAPTRHNRIRIANVREYDYDDACKFEAELKDLATKVDIPTALRLMKHIVPEFVCTNRFLTLE